MNSSNENTALLELLRPYFEHLIEVLISKGQMPDNENVFTSEDRDVFQSYRTSIFDAMVKRASLGEERESSFLVDIDV